MRDGIYTIKTPNESTPSSALFVVNDRACGYTFTWHGDLAVNEYYKGTEEVSGLDGYYDDPDGAYALIEELFGFAWLDDAEIEYFDVICEDMEEEFPEGGIQGDALDWWEEEFAA